jgi:hypothetical protein
MIDLQTRRDRGTDRTIVALVLVFSFAAATLINVDEQALTALKDVTLIAVGFYFGGALAGGQKDNGKQNKDDADKEG